MPMAASMIARDVSPPQGSFVPGCRSEDFADQRQSDDDNPAPSWPRV